MMNRQMLRQVEKLQRQMAQAQEELGREVATGSAGGGAVTVWLTGHNVVQKVSIDPEAAQDVEMLEELVATAVSDAIERVGELTKKKMAPFTAGLGGGLF
jgi:hypothetical protein